MENVKEAIRIVNDAETKSLLTSHKDIVLVLGCTGAGKSTLTQFIGSNNCSLTARKVRNTHLIVDDEQRINTGVMSHTIYPEFVYDQTHETAFYDCGGFNDTRSAAHDIASTYLIKRIIDYADQIKIVLVIAHPSVQEGADREGFMQLLRHVVTLIKDVNKFKASIALVVTKVYEIEEVEEKLEHILTEKIIYNVGEFLAMVKESFPAMRSEAGHYYSDESKEMVMRLIDILLITDDNGFHQRIGIFRKPTKPGALNEQNLLQQCKSQISTIIFENLHFTAMSNDDFGYTISDAAKNQIHEIVEVLNTIFSDMYVFCEEFNAHLTSVEQQNQNDLYKISETMLKANKMFEDFIADIKEHCSPMQFYQGLKKILTENSLESLHHCLTAQLQVAEYFDYLQAISETKLTPDTFSWTRQLSVIKSGAKAQHDSIKFLIAVFEKLSAYKIDENADELRDSNKFAEFSDQLISLTKIDYKCNLPINETKTKMFQNVLKQTLGHAIEWSTENGVLKITGFNLRLSEVPKGILNAKNVRNIQIFSLNKVFIDQDLCEIGKKINLIIVAPTWEIIGRPEINLSGSDGVRYKEDAEIGAYPGGRGSDGQDGRSGTDAGNAMLFGANFINSKALRVLANGGNGGPGQNGGFGGPGENGKKAQIVDTAENLPPGAILENTEDDGGWSVLKRVVTLGANSQNIKKTYTIPGHGGLDGGVGGKGGNGGAGGQYGLVNVVATSHQGPDFLVSRQDGTKGETGNSGSNGRKGAKGGSLLVDIKKKISTSVFFIPMIPTIEQFWKHVPGHASDLLNRGTNANEELADEVIEDVGNAADNYFRDSIMEYVQYVANNAESSLNYGELSMFCKKLQENLLNNSAIVEN